MIRIRGMLAVGIIALSAGVANAQTPISLGTGGTGGTPYTRGAFFSEIVNKKQADYKLSAQATGGYRDNLGLLLGGEIQIAMATLGDLISAYNGTGDFATIPNKEDFKKLRQLFVIAAVPHHLMVRADSGITKLEDIKGHKINLNTPASVTYAMNLRLLEVAGIPLSSFRPATVATGAIFDDIQNGLLDGAFTFLERGSARATQLALSVPLRFVSYDKKTIDGLNDYYDGSLIPYQIPAGIYPDQPEPINVFAVADSLIVSENADADMVYAITKAFWENLEYAGEVNREFKLLDLNEAVRDIPVPLHPGAERFFREKGLI